MRNRCTTTVLAVLLLFISSAAVAQEAVVGSGDPTIDRDMKAINAKAKENMKDFARRTGSRFGVPAEVVDALMNERKMSPADAHMTLNVAHTAKRPVEEVAETYERNRGKGWGVIAREMGIKPGSAEFHQLKANSRSGYADDSGEAMDDAKGTYKNKDKGKGKHSEKAKGKGKGKGKGKKQ